ncbi:S-layer homology domain-containing protein [Sporosarcina siberiensis]|uniref:S-layer homology domain-containing protein n=1 Tax=Sporosarcina siberiensis TaxID=1365606 RepID=A0ABW4SLK1_9BACL
MKKAIVFSIGFIFIFSLLFPQTSHASDIDGHWAKHDIQELVNRNIMGGYGNDVYLPNNNITRAEFIVLILGSLNINAQKYNNPFKDVIEGKWYHESVVTAAQIGLVAGTPSGNFEPNKAITRQDIAVMITSALEMKNIKLIESSDLFLDEKSIKPYAKPSVKRLQHIKIVAGKIAGPNNKYYFKPLDNATRAEAAVMLVRMLKAIEEPIQVIRTVPYNYDFKQMVDKQMAITGTARPKTDIAATWYESSRKMVEYYANPNNFKDSANGIYQFLVLSENAGLNKDEINEVLSDGGVLRNKGDAFLNASRTYGVNEMYLIAHSYLETGRGTSSLATGKLMVGVDKSGKAVTVTDSNKDELIDIKPVFNLFGIKANDSCPEVCGSIHAYEQGWFTVEKAIDGGAKFIAGNYFDRGQNTLYKMRWNPSTPGTHQYATDVAWVVKQTNRMRDMLVELYDKSNNVIRIFDVPQFNNTPVKTALPTGEEIFLIDTKHPSVGKKAKATAPFGVNFRTVPTTSSAFGNTIIDKLPLDTEVVIIAENANWFKVTVDNKEGWIFGENLAIEGVLSTSAVSSTTELKEETYEVSSTQEVISGKAIEEAITLKQEPNESSSILLELPIGTEIEILEEVNGWFKVSFDDQTGWTPVESITNLIEAN